MKLLIRSCSMDLVFLTDDHHVPSSMDFAKTDNINNVIGPSTDAEMIHVVKDSETNRLLETMRADVSPMIGLFIWPAHPA